MRRMILISPTLLAGLCDVARLNLLSVEDNRGRCRGWDTLVIEDSEAALVERVRALLRTDRSKRRRHDLVVRVVFDKPCGSIRAAKTAAAHMVQRYIPPTFSNEPPAADALYVLAVGPTGGVR